MDAFAYKAYFDKGAVTSMVELSEVGIAASWNNCSQPWYIC